MIVKRSLRTGIVCAFLGAGSIAQLQAQGVQGLGLQGQSATPECNKTPYAAENQTVNLRQNGIIDLGSRGGTAPKQMPAGVIPARILSHVPPKAARQDFDRAVRDWDRSHNKEAVSRLTDALRLDPGYIAAQVKLGAVYADSGQTEKALALFDRALTQEPNWALIHINRAAALVKLQRPEEAELAARRALRLEPGSIPASYLLGWAMLMQEKITAETAEYLAVAAGKNALARKALEAVQERLAKGQVR